MKTLKLQNAFGFLAIFFLVFMVACDTGTSQADLLSKSWVYDEVEVGDQTMTGDMLGNPVMRFNNNGTYKMEFGGMEESGTWKIEENKLITQGNDETEEAQELTILELTEELLVLEGEAEGTTMKVSLKPHVE